LASKGTGKLYICPTPIGNLEDITLRVLRVLQEVDLIVAEDTRTARKLLSHFSIAKPTLSFHKYNEAKRLGELLARLDKGERLALISEAGMPGIADPGHRLIKACLEKGFDYEVLPGPSALVTALVASGLPTESFIFQSFLPRRVSRRRAILRKLATMNQTIIIYEAPHRLVQLLTEIAVLMPEREAVLVRELTKKFEEFRRGTVKTLLESLQGKELKGEVILLIGPGQRLPVRPTDEEIRKLVIEKLKAGWSKKEAISDIAAVFDLPKRVVYDVVKDVRG
jgi:16S rRNA (cytidine1402-2'-O)-methyltransferase